MDDEGDFKKARGFLLTYSCLVVGLWYFKAELTQFNLMGVTLAFAHRKESIWLVVALVNAYFWFRFYQRLPRNALYFDGAMNDLYDRSLGWVAGKWNRRGLKRLAEQAFARQGAPAELFKIHGYYGTAVAKKRLGDADRDHGDEVPELHQVSRQFRTMTYVRVAYSYRVEGKRIPWPEYEGFDYQPGAFIALAVKTFVIMRGAFITPWFTDYVAPLALGFISTGVALYRWWEVNFAVLTG